jgi:hypothetical protein
MTEEVIQAQEPESVESILADATAEQPPAQAPAVAQAQPDPAAPEAKPEAEQPFWYRKRLKEIEQRAKAAERRAEELEQQRQAPQMPDPQQDPRAYFETQRVIMRLESSEDRFTDKHGEAEFEAVKDWLTTRPDIEAWAIQQRHPWGAAHQQYQREKFAAEIGDDPNAWREQERARLREEIQAEFTASAPMAPPRIPTPASGQRSVASRGGPAFAGPAPLKDILG